MGKIYSIEKSPLYRMRNKRKLSILLGLPEKYFFNKHEYKYYEYSKEKLNGIGKRYFSVPPKELKLIQKRICKLLMRIETPDWVMSCKKNCSYITNAERHIQNKFVKTMDIYNFYNSVKKSNVYKMFKEVFKMSDDISWIMTDLVTYKGVLPTGSPASQIIVYWTYCDMFSKINNIANTRGCFFTLYVDDMIFSSQYPISKELRKDVVEQLGKNSLQAKIVKDHYYQANDMKVITGVGIKNGVKTVLNKKRQSILSQYNKCKASKDIYDIEKLSGMLSAQRQIESNIFPEISNFIKHYESELKMINKKRNYKNIIKK